MNIKPSLKLSDYHQFNAVIHQTLWNPIDVIVRQTVPIFIHHIQQPICFAIQQITTNLVSHIHNDMTDENH